MDVQSDESEEEELMGDVADFLSRSSTPYKQ